MSTDRKEAAARMAKLGMSLEVIAHAFDREVSTIQTWLKEMKVDPQNATRHYHKQEKREVALQRFKQGDKMKDIAKELGVTPITVSRWVKALQYNSNVDLRERYTQAQITAALEDRFINKLSIQEIMEKHNIGSSRTLYKWINDHKEKMKEFDDEFQLKTQH